MKNKIKIEKEEKYYLFIILIGIVLTFLIYYFYRQFYLSLVPLLVSLSVFFILFYFVSFSTFFLSLKNQSRKQTTPTTIKSRAMSWEGVKKGINVFPLSSVRANSIKKRQIPYPMQYTGIKGNLCLPLFLKKRTMRTAARIKRKILSNN